MNALSLSPFSASADGHVGGNFIFCPVMVRFVIKEAGDMFEDIQITAKDIILRCYILIFQPMYSALLASAVLQPYLNHLIITIIDHVLYYLQV